jgi:3-phenylpropionate/cinnamic acid dioxygenase small subunit
MAAADIAAKIDALQIKYIASLDSRNMAQWLDTFAERDESSYVCTSAENVQANLPVAIIMDDNRQRLIDRIFFIEKVWAGTFQDYQTRHFVQRLDWEQDAHGHYKVRTNFSIMFTPVESGTSSLLTCGVYEDTLVETDQGLRFLSKRAIIDSELISRYFVYPL